MNSLYIGVGVALILALVTALVGPLFVDWTAYRATFEAESSRLIGLEVRVLGDVDARLLPSPRIRFGDVVVGDLERPVARIGRFELDLETAPLVRGEVRVAELALDRPALDVVLGEDGRLIGLDRLGAGGRLSGVALERVGIADGRFTVTDGRSGAIWSLDHVTATGSAETLAGPWKLDGAGTRTGERRVGFHASGTRVEGGSFGVRLQASPVDEPVTLALDATVHGATTGPTFTGTVSLDRRASGEGETASPAWRLAATIDGDARSATARDATLSIGPEERAAQFTGEGWLGFGAQASFSAKLTAKQLDLDRLSTGEAGRTTSVAGAIDRLLARLAGMVDPPLPGRLEVGIQGLVVGGGAVQEATIAARTRPGGWMIEQAEARLPGRTRARASGRFDLVGGARFEGRVEVSSDQPSALASWWRGAASSGDALDAMSLAGEVTLAAGEARGDDLALVLAGAPARGFFDWSGERGVKAGLRADRLEYDRLVRVVRAFHDDDGAGALDLDIDAGSLVVGGVTAQRASLRLGLSSERLSIGRLEIGDLAGARISGSGSIDHPTSLPEGTLDLDLTTAKPGELARTLARIAGDSILPEATVAAFAALAPVEAHLRFGGRRVDATTGEATLTVGGKAAGAKLSIDGRLHGRLDDPTHAGVALTANLDGDKLPPVVAGLFGGGASGAFGLRLEVRGTAMGEGIAIDGKARLGAATASTTAKIVAVGDGEARLDGRIEIAAPDVAALGALVGRPALAFERRVPVALAATVAGPLSRLEIAGIDGRIGETRIGGAGRLDASVRPMAFDGRLTIDRVDGAALVGLALGNGPLLIGTATGGAVWSSAALDEPLLGRVAGRIAMEVGRIDTGDTLGFDDARLTVVGRPGEIRVEEASGRFAGGRLSGTVTLARDPGGTVRASGRGGLEAADLAALSWRNGDRPVASGRLDGEVGFEASGRSVAALVASLSGRGRVGLGGVRLSGVGAEALSAVGAAVDAGSPATETEVGRIFAARTAVVDTAIDTLDVPLTVEAGVARSGRLVVETVSTRLVGRANVDLGRLAIDGEVTVEPAGRLAEISRTPISKGISAVGMRFQGALARPAVRLDVGPLVSYLTLRGLERDIERVENLEQDAMERARFARELRRLDEIHREAQAKAAAEKAAADRAAADKIAAEKAALAEKAAAEKAALAEKAEKAAAEKAAAAAEKAAAAASAAARNAPLSVLPPPIQIGPSPAVVGDPAAP